MNMNPILFPTRPSRGARTSSRGAVRERVLAPIHDADTPCPIRGACPDQPEEACCAFRAADAITALRELDAHRLAERLRCPASCGEARLLARSLRRHAELVERQRRRWPWRSVPVEEERPSPGIVVRRTRLVPHPPCDQELAVIRAAARWYEAVSARGLSVAVQK